MICKPCADAADGKGPRRPHCLVCGRRVEVYRSDVPVPEQSLYSHRKGGRRCTGSGTTPIYIAAHPKDCGCDCQHKPEGAWFQ